VHNFMTIYICVCVCVCARARIYIYIYIYIYMLILPIVRKWRGSGKYISLKKGEKVG
jgi:hypothetical protein